MPTYIRPARVDVIESGRGVGGLVLIAAGIAMAAAVVAFVLAHAVLLAVCAVVFIAVIGAAAVVFRRAASPRRWAEYRYPRLVVKVPAARPVQAISASRPKAIEAPRVIAAQPGEMTRERSR